MKNYLKLLILAALVIGFTAFIFRDKKVKVYLVGDSTMSEKEIKSYPETGWGMPFRFFFDSTVVIENHAKNGRSTRTFISENRWQPVADKLEEGDYVFIQFGHNDESEKKADRYTTPEQYKTNLLKFIAETQKKKAIPVLLTPVSRRRFDSLGNALETHPIYSDIVREIAKDKKIYFIDMDKKSKELYQQMGVKNSKFLFLQLAPGEHPNYPDGIEDNTHFNEFGARKIASIVLAEMKELKMDLVNKISKGRYK